MDAMIKHPLFGIGQEHWRTVAEKVYGWPPNKEAHSLWFQTGAELGIPGVTFLFLFYYLTVMRAWRASRQTMVSWMPTLARVMIVSLTGFGVSAAFVTVDGFELPYYVALLGACGVKLAYLEAAGELRYHADQYDPVPHAFHHGRPAAGISMLDGA
jgi:O-antigen ligase